MAVLHHLFVSYPFYSAVFLFAVAGVAYGSVHAFPDPSDHGPEALLLPVFFVNLAIAVVTVLVILRTMARLHLSATGVVWGYFLFAVITLAATRVFYILADRGVIMIADDTLEVWWHFIFYIALLLFILGLRLLLRLRKSVTHPPSPHMLLTWGVATGFFVAIVFLTAEPFDVSFTGIFSDTFLSRIGIQHWFAFAFCAVAARYCFRVRDRLGADITVLANPLLLSFAVMALYHAWELVTESLELIELSEVVIERVEQFLMVLAFLLLATAFYRMHYALFPQTEAVEPTYAQS